MFKLLLILDVSSIVKRFNSPDIQLSGYSSILIYFRIEPWLFHSYELTLSYDKTVSQLLTALGETLHDSAVSPLIDLGTQHDGRSAQTWMKRV